MGTIRGKMASLQRQALMQCGNFRDKTPLEALNVICVVKPIHLYVKELLVRANLRFKQTYLCSMREPSVNGHWNYSERLFNNVQIDLENSDFYYNKFPVPNYSTEIDLHQSFLNRDPGEEIHIYTDGSKSNNNVGCSSVLFDYRVTHYPLIQLGERLSSNTTVYQAELMGILKACAVFRDYTNNYDSRNL